MMQFCLSDDDSLDGFFANEEEDEVSWSDGGEVISACILVAANIIENRLAHSVNVVNRNLERKLNKKNQEKCFVRNVGQSDDVQALKYSNGARSVSKRMMKKTEDITLGIRGAAAEAIVMISEKAEEADFAGKLCPHREGRECLEATGKVAITGLGAAALVLDALYDTSRKVAKKGCEVTADVARHRYGESAGKLVENTGHVLGNAIRTLYLVNQMSGDNFTRAVARDSGKVKLNRQNSSNNNSMNCGRSDVSSNTENYCSNRNNLSFRSSSGSSSANNSPENSFIKSSTNLNSSQESTSSTNYIRYSSNGRHQESRSTQSCYSSNSFISPSTKRSKLHSSRRSPNSVRSMKYKKMDGMISDLHSKPGSLFIV